MWCTSIVARVITPTKHVNTHACEYRMSMTQEQQQQRCFDLKFPYKKVRKSAKTASHASTELSRRHVRENELSPCLCLRSPCVGEETTTLKVVVLCREPLNQTTNLDDLTIIAVWRCKSGTLVYRNIPHGTSYRRIGFRPTSPSWPGPFPARWGAAPCGCRRQRPQPRQHTPLPGGPRGTGLDRRMDKPLNGDYGRLWDSFGCCVQKLVTAR